MHPGTRNTEIFKMCTLNADGKKIISILLTTVFQSQNLSSTSPFTLDILLLALPP